jgi:ketosteroid isomerase-like protein
MYRMLTLVFFIFSACNNQADFSEKAKEEIIKTDKAMSDIAVKEGFFKTLLLYADDSVVKPSEGKLPIIGKTNLQNDWSGKKDLKNISWEPFKAEAARSGDLGYTLGRWKATSKDTVDYGFYYTIWKKQPDGKWKFVVDGGNNTPPPMK